MDNHVEKIKEILNKDKRKIIRGTIISLILVGVLGLTGFAFIYTKAKSNINYTVEEAKLIALQVVQGDVLKVKRELEIENLSFEYKFKIRDINNILRKVKVDSRFGVITEIDFYFD